MSVYESSAGKSPPIRASRKRSKIPIELYVVGGALALIAIIAAVAAVVMQPAHTPTSGKNKAGASPSASTNGKTWTNWQGTVEDWLKSHENKFTITKWYPPESLIGATYFDEDIRVWMPVDRLPRTTSITLIGQNGPLQDKDFEAVRAGRAVRVQYQTDEGFSRSLDHDEVFVVDGAGTINRRVDTNKFRIGKPQDKPLGKIQDPGENSRKSHCNPKGHHPRKIQNSRERRWGHSTPPAVLFHHKRKH